MKHCPHCGISAENDAKLRARFPQAPTTPFFAPPEPQCAPQRQPAPPQFYRVSEGPAPYPRQYQPDPIPVEVAQYDIAAALVRAGALWADESINFDIWPECDSRPTKIAYKLGSDSYGYTREQLEAICAISIWGWRFDSLAAAHGDESYLEVVFTATAPDKPKEPTT